MEMFMHSIPNGAGFETPHLDLLLETGVVFTQCPLVCFCLCADTICDSSPVITSIADAILVEHGIIFQGVRLYLNQQTIADVLRRSGYSTAFLGKSHLGSTFLKQLMEQLQIVLMMRTLSQRFRDGPIDHGFECSLTLPAGIQSEPYAFFQK